MFIYNVTIKLDWSIHEEWLLWVKEEEIPGMLATEHFYNYQMVRLLEVDEEEGPTYAIQYYAQTKEDCTNFLQHTVSRFTETATNKWGQKFIRFSTLMEVVK